MEWRDTGFLLSTRPHGETSVILEAFTKSKGRHVGILRGGTSRKMAPHLQPGTELDLTWRARLEDHIGAFTIEPLRSRTAAAMTDRLALSGLNAVCALLSFALPEREAHEALYARSSALLDMLSDQTLWPLAYLQWELALLEDLGFGLDLTTCAATGTTHDLVYLSPKTGRAVSREGAGDWAPRLLPLPPILLWHGDTSAASVLDGLKITGYFLEHRLAAELKDRDLPAARGVFVDRLSRQRQL